MKSSWIEALLLVGAGAVGALGFAPCHWVICLALSLSLVLWKLDKSTPTPKAAFWTLWLWGLGHFGVAFHWVSYSLGVDWGKFFWVLPFSLGGIPALLALFPALFCGFLYHRFTPGVSRWLFFAAAWGCGEWVRGTMILGGFPWNLVGAVWGACVPILQSTSIVGIYGLGVLTVLLATVPYLFVAATPRTSVFVKLLYGAGMACVFLAMGFWGTLRVKPPTFVPQAWIRLVQPNVDQKRKWSPEGRVERQQELYALTSSASLNPLTHIVWPECPLPFVVKDRATLRPLRLPLKPGQTLLTGMLRFKEHPEPGMLFNSLMAVAHTGDVVGVYDKVHLVPFGEYVPLRRFLGRFMSTSWIGKMSAGEVDFVPGPHAATLTLPGLPPVSPLICFDVAFPGEVADRQARPSWLLDITNDGWFGDSWGLVQHFEQGRFRAVEEGLPLVRVANTGISGVVTAYGEVLAQLPSNTQAVWDFALPCALPPTFYVRWGNFLFWVLVVFLLAYGRWTYLTEPQGRFSKRSSSFGSLSLGTSSFRRSSSERRRRTKTFFHKR